MKKIRELKKKYEYPIAVFNFVTGVSAFVYLFIYRFVIM